MSVLDTIYNNTTPITNNNTSSDVATSDNNEAVSSNDTASNITSDISEPIINEQPDEYVNKTGDDEIDSIREKISDVGGILITNRDIVKSDYSCEIHDTMIDILADTAQKLIKFRFYNQNIFDLNFLTTNNIDFKIIPQLPNEPFDYKAIKALNMPVLKSTLSEVKEIDFDELNELIIKTNNILEKIDSRNFLTISNSVIIPLTTTIRKIKDIQQYLSDFGKNDVNNILNESDKENYLNIFNYKTNMIAISNAYNILELSDIIYPLSEANRIDDSYFQNLLDFDTTKNLQRVHKVLSNYPLIDDLPQSVKDLFYKLDNSDIYSKNLSTVALGLFVFNNFSDQIKFLSNGLGILSIKKANTRNEIDFNSLKSNINRIIDNIDINYINAMVNKIISFFDEDTILLKRQVGIIIQKLDTNNLGIDPEFYNLLRLLVEVKEKYQYAIKAINKLSIDSPIMLRYMSAMVVISKIQPSVIKLNKILSQLEENPSLMSKLNEIIEDIHNERESLDIVYNDLKNLNLIIQPVYNQFSELDIVPYFMNLMRELLSNIENLTKEYSFNINKLDVLKTDYNYIYTLRSASIQYSNFIRDLFSSIKYLHELISEIKDLYALIYKYQFGIVGYNNMYNDAEYVEFIEFEKLIGFLQSGTQYDLINHENFSITDVDIINIKRDFDDYVSKFYSENIIDIGVRVSYKLPEDVKQVTVFQIQQVESRAQEMSDKKNLILFLKLLTIRDQLNLLQPMEVNLDVDQLNRKIKLINYAINNAGKFTEYDLKNRMYFCEEYKNEIIEITQSLNKKDSSQDINTLYLITPPNINIQDELLELANYYDKFAEYCDTAMYYMNKILVMFGNLETFTKELMLSSDIIIQGNTISFAFDDEDILSMKLYATSFIELENDFNRVYRESLFFFNNMYDIIMEIKRLIDLSKIKDKKSLEHFDLSFKNIDIIEKKDQETNHTPVTSYHKINVGKITRNILEQNGLSDINYDLIMEKLDELYNTAMTLQKTIPQKIMYETHKVRAKVMGYQNTDQTSKLFNKISIKTKEEAVTYSNLGVGETAANPLNPMRKVVEPFFNYPGMDYNAYPFESNGVYYNKLLRISSEYAVYPTNYLSTTNDNQIVQIYKIFKITKTILGGVSAKLTGYGYYDQNNSSFKFVKTLPFEFQLYDENYKEDKLGKLCYSTGYGSLSNSCNIDNNQLLTFTYNNNTLLGLCDSNGNVYLRSSESIDSLDLTKNTTIGVDKIYTISNLKMYRFGNYFGINNETYASYVFELKDALDNSFDAILKNGIYIVDDQNNYYGANIFNIYGNSIDTSNTFTVTLANNNQINVNRIKFLNYVLPDYFLVTKSEFIDGLNILITPDQLSESESLRQQANIVDKNAFKLKDILNLNYLPTKVISSIHRFSNIYYTDELIAINGRTYNKAYNIHGEYIGFTNGYEIIFDVKLQCSNEIKIYKDKLGPVFTTETNI